MDCYLCGATNPDDADHCERCGGQLLKLSFDEPAPEASGQRESTADKASPAETPAAAVAAGSRSTKRVLGSLKSLEHDRLSAALGLGGRTEAEAEDSTEGSAPAGPADRSDSTAASPTSTPGIPMIGTRVTPAGRPTRERDKGRLAYVGIAALLALVGWFGYKTVTGSTPPPPDQLALTDTTSTIPDAIQTTTTNGPRPWSESEVRNQFSRVFITVELHACPTPGFEAAADENEMHPGSLDAWTTTGVLVDPHTVVFESDRLAEADVAVARTRFGAASLGRVSSHPSGIGILTTTASSNRFLELTDDANAQPRFSITWDAAARSAVVGDVGAFTTAEPRIIASDQGAAVMVLVGPTELRGADLRALEGGITVLDQDAVVDKDTICGRAPGLVDPLTLPEMESTDQ